ncbi:hypothetical protein OPIT5_11355 [Opitutaceae bacterium TAV5]|nr:hypothetical protein OPIT5_11355 [Opitutaceae bacterium TAV5]
MQNTSRYILTIRSAIFVVAAFFTPVIHAQFATGFETSTYTAGSTIIGITEPTASAKWEDGFNNSSSAVIIASIANPYSGSQHLRITNDASTARSATLNLGSSFFDTTAGAGDITIAFAFAVGADVSAGTGGQAQFYLGTKNTDFANPYWFGLLYNDGKIDLRVNGSTGISSAAFTIGQYTDFSALGGYVRCEIVIDPTTQKYKSVKLFGTLADADLTSIVQSSASGGTIPHIAAPSGAIPNYFSVITGSNDTLTLDVDAISISQTSIPEPASSAVLFAVLATSGMFFLRHSRTRVRS